MDKLCALRYFAHLANTLNFSVTADHFQVPSSSVSRRIKDLEQDLGAALFERTTRSVHLTDLGKLYLREVGSALQSIDMADELVGAQSKSPSGMLRITAMPGYGERYVLPALDKLRGLYSDIDFDVNFTDEVINLAGNEVDIAIRTASSLSEHGVPKTSGDLIERSVLVYRAPYGVLDWLVMRDGHWRPVDLKPKYITNHGQSLLDSVLAGKGFAFLPRWGVDSEIAAGRLTEVELEDGPLSGSGDSDRGLYLLYHPPKFRLQKIRVSVDFLVKELAV